MLGFETVSYLPTGYNERRGQMDEIAFIRLVFFTFFFIIITLTLVAIEFVYRIVSKLKSLMRKERESLMEWRLTGDSPEVSD